MKQTNTDWRDYEKDTAKIISLTRKIDDEEFERIYYDSQIANMGRNSSLLSSFLMEIGKEITYSESRQTAILIKPVKERMAANMGTTLGRVNNMITKLEKMGLLTRIARATYEVSPFIIAKDGWAEAKELQLTYDKERKELKIEAPMPSYFSM